MSRPDFSRPVYFDWSTPVFRPSRGTSLIYIVEFEGNIVKVGKSTDFNTRLSGLSSDFRTKGRDLLRYWHVETPNAASDEPGLIRLAHVLGGKPMKYGVEWFTDLDVAELIFAAERDLVPMAITQPR